MTVIERESQLSNGRRAYQEEAPAAIPTVVPAGEGAVLHAFGSTVRMPLGAEQTNGAMTVHLATIPPGGGPPPHVHANEDELFLIIEGQFRFLVSDEWTQPVGAGTVVYAPRGSRHTFQNAGDTPGRFWGISTPSGFERFFARCADVFAQPGPPDIGRIVAISAEHGMEYVPPLVPSEVSRKEVPVEDHPIVVSAGEGTMLHAFGDALQLKLSGEQTNGSLAVSHYTVAPGGGPPPHRHQHEDELFLIIEGQIRFLVDDEWTQPVGAGTAVYAPRGSRHTFQNVADTPGRFWIITTPSGFEQFFARCADVFAQPGPPDMDRIVAISTEHDIEYVPALMAPPPVSA